MTSDPVPPRPPAPPAPAPAGRPGRNPAKGFLVGCLSLLGAVVLVAVLFVVLLLKQWDTPEHERGVFDQRGGKELAGEPCAELERELKPEVPARDMKTNWDPERGFTVTCAFTISGSGGPWTASVGYIVLHQPLLFGRDRTEQLDSLYGGQDFVQRKELDDQKFTHWRTLPNIGDRAKTYLLWDDQDGSPTGSETFDTDDDPDDRRHFKLDQWLETGTVSRIAKVRADNTFVEAEIQARSRPFARESDAPVPPQEVEAAVAQRFSPPIEQLARQAVAALE